MPANGDLNPAGLAVVPAGFPGGGLIHAGEYLVSNFNNSTNTPGTGTTIVAIKPGQNPATAPVFFSSQAGGLDESLTVLKSGFVIVGNVPTTDDTSGPGSLQIINRFGQVVQTLSDANTNSNLFDGPWASAVNDKGNTVQLFVSNVESGAITRINFKVVKKHGQANLKVVSTTQIASGYTVTPATVSTPAARCLRPDEPRLGRRGRGAANRRELAGPLGVVLHDHKRVLDFRPGCQLRRVWGDDGLQCE